MLARQQRTTDLVQRSVTSAQQNAYEVMNVGKSMARALAQTLPSETDRILFARTFCFEILSTYWHCLQRKYSKSWPLPRPFDSAPDADLPDSARVFARRMGEAATSFELNHASYLVGITYTSMLPAAFRGKHGVYYTPPALTDQLLTMATEAGVDWASCRVLDPACGGGAFLTPLAQRIVSELGDREPAVVLEILSSRLWGFEKDPFGAWMSQVFLEMAVLDICHAARRRLPRLIEVCDSLEQQPRQDGFDLVIGNPPYGRVSLTPKQRAVYKRGLFGHANLYGLFTDLALRLTRPGGVIAYVTPTSFLAGEYFKALRGLLGREAPPHGIAFVSERKGVFEDVLQETLLAAYRRGIDSTCGVVRFISTQDNDTVSITTTGFFNLPDDPTRPWLLPRHPGQAALVERLRQMPHRLRDYGYTVSTGPLVWNRHKQQLRDQSGEGCYPLIWGEAITPSGEFVFRACKRNHKPYFQTRSGDDWLVTREPCVLLQRTTAKEQRRRLIAAELPASLIERHGAVVIENHLNMIRQRSCKAPTVSIKVLSALLNSEILDQAFRCINGSVAVSAFELEALPLPPPEDIRQIQALVTHRAKKSEIDHAIERLYLGEER